MSIKNIVKSDIDKLPVILLTITTVYLFLSPLVINTGSVSDAAATVLIAVLTYAEVKFLFKTAEKVNGKNIVYISYLFVLLLAILSSRIRCADMSFLDWILSGTQYSRTYFPFAVFVFAIFIIFISSTIFYIAEIRFSGGLIIYALLIPLCFEYVQAVDPTVTEIMLLTVSLISVLIRGFAKKDGAKIVYNKSFRMVSAAGLIFCAIACIFLPKPLSPPYGKVLDIITAFNPFENKGFNNLGRLSDISGANNYKNTNTSRLLYTVNANESLYLKRQSFIFFDGKDWHTDENSVLERININDVKDNTALEEYYDMLRENYDSQRDIFDAYGIAYDDIPDIKSIKSTAHIKTEKFIADYAIAPLRNISTLVTGYKMPQNGYGAMKFMYAYPFAEYTDTYFSDNLRNEAGILRFSEKFHGIDEFLDFNWRFYSLYPEISQNIEADICIAYKFMNGEEYKSPRIERLAESITSGLESDYEKALALERYFSENGYVYDKDSENESIENFIFGSKAGTCGHYATAMTLMARSAGLAARYTEGFLTQKTDIENEYQITGADSHAYVEIYIPGYGFSVFDPTVSDDTDTAESVADRINGAVKNYGVYIFFGTLFSIVFIYAFIYAVLPVFSDLSFFLKLKSSDRKFSEYYRYIQKTLFKNGNKDIFTLTPRETAEFVKKKYNYDIGFVANGFEKEFFSGDKAVLCEGHKQKVAELLGIIRKYKEKSDL